METNGVYCVHGARNFTPRRITQYSRVLHFDVFLRASIHTNEREGCTVRSLPLGCGDYEVVSITNKTHDVEFASGAIQVV